MSGQSEETKIAVLETQMSAMVKSVDSLGGKIDILTDKIDNHYVKKEDFNPVKRQVDSLRLWQAKVLGIVIAVDAIIGIIVWVYINGK